MKTIKLLSLVALLMSVASCAHMGGKSCEKKCDKKAESCSKEKSCCKEGKSCAKKS